MEKKLNVNWYPGHMVKSRREIAEKLMLIDIVIEVLDARAPMATQNHDFDSLFGSKKRMYILNKSDMADETVTKAWADYFNKNGVHATAFSAVSGNTSALLKSIQLCAQDIYDRYAKKGVKKTVRAIICGIPNVGKSAILNKLSGTKKLKVGNMPGVTRGLSWVRLNPYLELMDSPGMLPPKIDNERSGAIIAAIGSIRRDILDEDALAVYLISMLTKLCPELLSKRYGIPAHDSDPVKILEQICKARGFVIMGGEPDYDRAVQTLFEDFKNARLGRISLERPPEA